MALASALAGAVAYAGLSVAPSVPGGVLTVAAAALLVAAWPLAAAEIAALEELDVPHFSLSILETLPGVSARSGYAELVERIRALTDRSLDQQLALFDQAFRDVEA